MTDISSHPLLKQAYDVCQAIEKCGATRQLTDAVCLASDLMRAIDAHLHVTRVEPAPPKSADLQLSEARGPFYEALLRAGYVGGLPAQAGSLLDPLEQAIDQTVRLISECQGNQEARLTNHLDALLAEQLKRVTDHE